MQLDKKLTTAQHQQQQALRPNRAIGRDVRFRIFSSDSGAVRLYCQLCSHDFTVATRPENYYFACQLCKAVGCLPGVLAAQADRDAEQLPEDERKAFIKARVIEMQEAYPQPPAAVPPVVQQYKQST